MFLAEHPLHLVVGKAGCDLLAPVTALNQDVAGLGVAGNQIGIAQTGKGLVQVIPRHPFAVHCLDPSSRDGLPQFATAGNTADIAVARSFLATLQFRNHVVQPTAQFTIGRIRPRGDHRRERGKIVPASVPGETAAFPITVRFCLRLQSRFTQIRREETIRLQRQQIRSVGLHRIGKGTLQQSHRSQWQHLGGSGHNLRLARLNCEC